MTRPRVLCAESSHFSDVLDELAPTADVDRVDVDQAGLLEIVRDYDVVLVRLRLRVDQAVIDAAPRLRAVVSPTTGLDHLDLDGLDRAGVAVIHLRGQLDLLRTITSTAEHSWALLLALVRHLPAAAGDVLAGGWRPDAFRGNELVGKTIGIVGLGRVGTMVAAYAAAFGMDVVAVDTRDDASAPGVRRVTLDELLETADVVSVHVPLSQETTGLLGARELRRLRPGGWLVNTSRGEIVDDDALLGCLEDGHLAGAAVDVLSDERLVDPTAHRLVEWARRHRNLLITPHIAGATVEAVQKADRHCVERLAALLEAGA